MIFNVNVGTPLRPVGYFAYNGGTYRFDGTSQAAWGGFGYYPYGTSGWKIKIWVSGVFVHFDFINPSHSIGFSLIGPGAEAGADDSGAYDASLFYAEGGHGGAGGGRTTGYANLTPGCTVSATLNAATTSLSNAISANAAKGNGTTPGAGNATGFGGIGEFVKYGREDPSYRNATAGGNGIYLFNDSSFDGKLYGAGAGGKGAPVGIGGHAGANGAGWENEGSGGGAGRGARTGIIALWYKG